MNTNFTSKQMFPEFERFVNSSGLKDKKGNVVVHIARILGNGKTRAKGLDIPPAEIERQEELSKFSFPLAPKIPPELQTEIESARATVAESEKRLRNSDLRRRFALETLHKLKEQFNIETGFKDNQFFAVPFILVPDKNGRSWSWSMTPHYPFVSNIPADIDYIIQGYKKSKEELLNTAMPADEFTNTLKLSWMLAKFFDKSDDVLIADVARLFNVAAQSSKFWRTPTKSRFTDFPEGVFISNLINWHRNQKTKEAGNFQLVPATLNQALGPNAKPYYIPTNIEGTNFKPMIYIRSIQTKRDS